MTTCKHADSGCNYPEGECLGVCMGAQHTPGPWKMEIFEAGGFSIERDGAGLAGGLLVIADRGEHPKLAAEMHANAALIAAAPELLEVLQSVVKFWDSITTEDRVNDLHDKARHVIAKATRSASHD